MSPVPEDGISSKEAVINHLALAKAYKAGLRAEELQDKLTQLESRLWQLETSSNQHQADIQHLKRTEENLMALEGLIGAMSGALSKSSSQPTFVVDSSQAVQKWLGNVRSKGEDYTHVHINQGEYTILTGRAINLSSTQTKRVTADSGATITLKGAGNVNFCVLTSNGTDDIVIEDLTVKLAVDFLGGAKVAAGFQGIKTLYRCRVIGNPKGKSTSCPTIVGFRSCQNLFDCHSLVVAGSTADHTGGKEAVGFIDCTNVVQCHSAPQVNGAGSLSVANTVGYRNCVNLLQCSCLGTLTAKYQECTHTLLCDDKI